MAILTGPEIELAVERGDITFEPFDRAMVGSNSVDFTLGDKLLEYLPQDHIDGCGMYEDRDGDFWRCADRCRFGKVILDPHHGNPTRELNISTDGMILSPGVLYLGCTREIFGSIKYVPQLAARSSWGRLGMSVYLNSGFGDTGFVGRWTLEITVVHPLVIRPGDRVGQVYFTDTFGELRQYKGRYQKPEGPQAARLHLDTKS